MKLVTISRELNTAEADLKSARLQAAGFHPVVTNDPCALYMGTAIATGGIRLQVPEEEAEEASALLDTGAQRPS